MDYLLLLKKEGKISQTHEEIEDHSYNPADQEKIKKRIMDELRGYELLKKQKVSSLRAFEIYCKIVVKEDISTGLYVWNDFVKAQFILVERNELTVYLAAREHGKSVSEDTLVSTGRGLVPIKDVQVGDTVLSLNELEYKNRLNEVTKKTPPYKKYLFRITLGSGRELETTTDHPFFAIGGWKNIKQGLGVGDYIATPREIGLVGINDNIYLARILGLVISEGYTKKFILFSNQDKNLHQIVHDCCDNLDISYSFKRGKTSKSGVVYETRIFQKLFEIIPEIKGTSSYTKFVPPYILQGNKQVIVEFLRHLFEGDGGVETNSNAVSYCSMSKKLLLQVQLLLQQLGMQSLLRKKNFTFRNKKYTSYRLFLNGPDVFKFQKVIGFVSDRKTESLASVCENLSNKTRNPILDVIPRFGYFENHFIGDQECFSRRSAKKFVNKKSKMNINRANPQYREDLCKLIKGGDLIKLDKLSKSDIYWDPITNIEPIGNQTCYDLQVEEGTHNFVANGIYAHNTFFAILYTSFKQFIVAGMDILMAFNIPKMIRRFFRVYRRVIDNNEFLMEKKDTTNLRTLIWGQTECEYNSGLITGITLGTTPRSAHVNLVWVDDLLKEEKTYSNEYVKNYVLSELMQCIGRKKGRFVIEGTPISEEDIYHYLFQDKEKKVRRKLLLCTRENVFISAKGWACRIFPGILDHATKKTLVPEVFTYEDLIIKRDKKIGEYRFFREIMCECKINKSALISYFLFMKNANKKESLQETGTREKGKKYVMFVDPSAGEGEYSDYSAICIIEKGIDGHMHTLRYAWHEKLLPIIDPQGGKIDFTHKVVDVFNDFNMGKENACELWVEDNSLGRVLIQNLRHEGVDPYEHTTKFDKIELIMEAVSMLKNDKVAIPNNPECGVTQEWIPILRQECLNFGIRKDARGRLIAGPTSGNDDLLISFLFALYHCTEDASNLPLALCQD